MSWSTPTAVAVRLGICLIAAESFGGCTLRERPPAVSPSDAFAKVRPGPIGAKPPPAARPLTLENAAADLAVARRRLTLAPTGVNHRRLAEGYVRYRVLDLAFDHFTAAVKLNRADASSYDGLARIWRDWGLPQLGLADAYRAVYHAPRSAVAQNTLGTVLLRIGHPAAAQAAFERALRFEPQAAYAANNLCFLSLTHGDSRQAIDACERALAMRPDLRTARNNLALAYATAGDFARAQTAFSAGGDTATAAYNMGIAYMTARRLDQAAAAFLIAWQARPGFHQAGDRLMQVDAMRFR